MWAVCQHSFKVVFSVSPCIEQLAFASRSFILFRFLPLKELFIYFPPISTHIYSPLLQNEIFILFYASLLQSAKIQY